MKRIIAIFFAVFLALSAAELTPQQKYIEKYAKVAVREMERTGVPASITLAQGLLESRYGQSSLASEFNNHFGIKCHSDWRGARTYFDDDKRNECFRVYSSAEESFKDHSDFLRYQSRYHSLFDLKPDDYKGWARGLKAAGYATDPSYAVKLIQLIEEYELYEYDYGGKPGRKSKKDRHEEVVKVPKSPAEMEAPHIVDQNYMEEYSFSLARPVYEINGVPFVYAMEGETYESIALAYNLFRKELLHFNDLNRDSRLDPGTVVFLAAKKNQSAKGLDKYIIGPDERITLRDIAQRFAVKEHSLRKLNGLDASYVPLEGDTILLRK